MINIKISPGESYDRLSILHIKINKINDANKRRKVLEQYSDLQHIIDEYNNSLSDKLTDADRSKISEAYSRLMKINGSLWDVEDELREREHQHQFDDKFVQLARSVYHLNDRRHAVKVEIDTTYSIELTEQKQYSDYEKNITIS